MPREPILREAEFLRKEAIEQFRQTSRKSRRTCQRRDVPVAQQALAPAAELPPRMATWTSCSTASHRFVGVGIVATAMKTHPSIKTQEFEQMPTDKLSMADEKQGRTHTEEISRGEMRIKQIARGTHGPPRARNQLGSPLDCRGGRSITFLAVSQKRPRQEKTGSLPTSGHVGGRR